MFFFVLNVFGHFQFCLVVLKCFSLSEGFSWLLRRPFRLVALLKSFKFNCLRGFFGCSSCKRRFCFGGSCCRRKKVFRCFFFLKKMFQIVWVAQVVPSRFYCLVVFRMVYVV